MLASSPVLPDDRHRATRSLERALSRQSVRERQGAFVWGGPQKIEFTLSLVRDDDNAIANRVFTFA